MEYQIVACSNYIMILLLFCYVAVTFAAMSTRQTTVGLRRLSAAFVISQRISRYLIFCIGYLTLLLVMKDTRLILLWIFQLIFFAFTEVCQQHWYSKCSGFLFQNMLLLLSVGFLMLSRLSFDKAFRQFMFAVAAVAFSVVLPMLLRYIKRPENYWILYSAGGIGLLLLVLLNGVSAFGAKNWLSIKGIVFQPSEFVKLLFILSMASLLTMKKKKELVHLTFLSIVAAAHVGLLAATNDYGGALIFFVVYLIMIFAVRGSVLFPLTACSLGVAAGWFVCRYSGHVADRILAWKNPFPYIQKEGYQMAQSLFAIANGDWFGTGLGQGMPKTVPVVTSDFIFSAVTEEFGAAFAALLLLVYISTLMGMISIAFSCKQPFYYAVSVGAVALFGFQMFLNVGGVIKLIPSTGVTLAFISYGGSSMITTVFLLQGLQAVYGYTLTQNEILSDTETKAVYSNTETLQTNTTKPYQINRIYFTIVSVFMLLTLGATIVYFLMVTVPYSKSKSMNEYNQRVQVIEQQVLRGKILTSDGHVLAQTILGEDGMMYRVYPYGEAAAFITGRNNMGKSGLEEQEALSLLSVGVSELEQFRWKWNHSMAEGNSLVTTIDLFMQQTAYQLLKQYRGAIGVMEISSGRLLTMVSMPAYNPNEVTELWDQLNHSTKAPLLNRFTQGLYPPGSTFKLVTTLAYLKNHKEKDFNYTCMGSESVRGVTVNCYHHMKHGTQSIQEAFVHSCNTAFSILGSQSSYEDYTSITDQLGFNQVWPKTIPYQESSFTLSETTPDIVAVQTSFGQGETLITPFQNLMIAAAIANDGVLVLPYLVEKVQNLHGTILETRSSQGMQTLMTKEEANLLEAYMTEASRRYMTEFSEQGITVAGKTGSAENGTGAAHSWYLCFAGREEPEIAICVLLENAGLGSEHAMPAAKELISCWFLNH